MKAFQFLLQRPGLAIPGKESELKGALLNFLTKLNAVRSAARDRNQILAADRFEELSRSWANVKELYPPEFLRSVSELSGRFSCPAHANITGREGDVCSECGRSLQLIEQFCGLPSSEPIVRASAHLQRGFVPGEPAQITLRLARKDGSPIRENDLLTTHTARIHFFAIDPTFSDYHHEHPVPTSTPGDYVVNFVPKSAGGYRVWLDLLPTVSRREEMPSLDLGPLGPASIARNQSEVFTNGVWRLRFAISQAPLKAGFPARATLTVTDSAGTPCTRLEPIMGSFAHFVAFHEDFQTIFHLHPAGIKEVLDPALRGGPEVQLYLPGLKAGFVLLFAQIQVDGKVITAPFGILVQT